MDKGKKVGIILDTRVALPSVQKHSYAAKSFVPDGMMERKRGKSIVELESENITSPSIIVFVIHAGAMIQQQFQNLPEH